MSQRQQDRKLKFIKNAGIALCVGITAISTTYGWAMNSQSDAYTQLPQIWRGDDAFERLRNAYEAVRTDAFAKDLLRDTHKNALSITQRIAGQGVETTKFQHYYKGIEVLGSMSFHHATPKGVQVRHLIKTFDVDTQPRITRETAVALAKAVAGEHALAATPELKILPAAKDRSAKLIYWVELKSEGATQPGADVLIDAHTGRLVANMSKLETIANVQVVTAKNQGLMLTPVARQGANGHPQLVSCKLADLATGRARTLSRAQCLPILQGQDSPLIPQNACQFVLFDGQEGAPAMLNPAACRQVVTDSAAGAAADDAANRALSNSQLVLNYYQDTHGRNSYDNQGSDLVSVVHAGKNFANAAWLQDLDFMIYGDGDGQLMGDMTQGVDVAGHEMTHGVTAHTAKLTMMDEQGAINEANSDFFGKMIANDGTWMMGASLSLDLQKFPGIRNLADPASLTDTILDDSGNPVKQPYPATLADKATTSNPCGQDNDRCWIHHNSTIISHARYLVHQALGKDKAQAIYYLSLTQYLNSQAGFQDEAQAAMAACQAKYDSASCDQVRQAYAQVGLQIQ